MPSAHNSRRKANQERTVRNIRKHHGKSTNGFPAYSKFSNKKRITGKKFSNRKTGSRVPGTGTYVSEPLDAQIFDYLIVIDFEATCERDTPNYPHEIIEFPAVVIDLRCGAIDEDMEFHSYVRPVNNPKLSAFCKELTGIQQATVDKAPVMQEVMDSFVEWYKETIPLGAKVAFATDGPSDFEQFLFKCAVVRDGVRVPTIMYEYIDIRKSFSFLFNHRMHVKSVSQMLAYFRLQFKGRQHSGLDDSRNIARIAIEMARSGRCVFSFLNCIPLDEEKTHYTLPGYPTYRHDAGSGFLDGDIVNDIAKNCFGDDYFEFGEAHAEAVQEYRMQNPDDFTNAYDMLHYNRSSRRAPSFRVKFAFILALVLFFAAIAFLKRYLLRTEMEVE